MTSRPYYSSVRTAAVAEKRKRVVEAASRLLREEDISGFSLNAAAQAAGVTRLTVYNQFGSRKGLLEAVFDDCALDGGLWRIPEAMMLPDPRTALERLIEIFCGFWGSSAAVGRLHGATALDAEFALAIAERNEKRRTAIAVLVGRVDAETAVDRKDTIDLIFAMTSYPMFEMLSRDRTAEAASALVRSACLAVFEATTIPG